jgi:flagellar P-ring protein precursor FlgI
MFGRSISILSLLRRLTAATALLSVIGTGSALGNSRIKDIADFEGIRDNMLVGYGLVVGLNGTGDASDMAFTQQSMIGMLERLGVNTRDLTTSLKSKNVAAVMVTSKLPPFSRQGTRIDVNVSAMGDAKNLQGGTLLVTPLVGADGEVYAVAQGNVATGGFSASGAAASVTKGVPTAGRIANGAIIEREIAFELSRLSSVRVSLRNPDLTTSRRVSQAINAFMGTSAARAIDPATVEILVPDSYKGDVAGMLTDIETLRVQPDQTARVIIDETSGTIVMGENVRINQVAIAQGSLTIRVTETKQVSQPSPFSTAGTTTSVDRTDIEVDEGADKKLDILTSGVTLRELVEGLNRLGVGPRDMITILQAIKAAGALQAELELM